MTAAQSISAAMAAYDAEAMQLRARLEKAHSLLARSLGCLEAHAEVHAPVPLQAQLMDEIRAQVWPPSTVDSSEVS